MLNRLLFACLLGLVAVLPARAASVLPLFLDEIIDKSAVAFQGTCTDNRSERDERGTLVTYTTFEVHDQLKGKAASTYTIKQIGGSLPDGSLNFKIEGVPSFTVGQSYVVFLPGVSSAGFSSPVGLSQGRFNIVAEGAGLKVTNGRDFKELTSRIPQQAMPKSALAKMQAAGPVTLLPLEEFKSIVRQRAGASR